MGSHITIYTITWVGFAVRYWLFAIGCWALPIANPVEFARRLFHRANRRGLEYIQKDTSRWKVATYLSESLQPRLVRQEFEHDNTLGFIYDYSPRLLFWFGPGRRLYTITI